MPVLLRSLSIISPLVAVWTMACIGGSATAATFSFSSVRDTKSPEYTRFVGGPSINDEGVVAYLAVKSGQGRVETTGGSFGLDVDFDQDTLSNPTVINGAANPYVAFKFTPSRPNVVILLSRLIFYITTNGAFADFGVPAINDLGAVAFYADLDDGGRGIYVDEGPFGDDYTIANNQGLFKSFGRDVAIDNAGRVAFTVASGDFEAIFLAADSSGYEVVANTSGPLKSLRGLSINERGVVAFSGELDSGGSGVFTSSVGEPVVTIAESDGPPNASGAQFTAFGKPVINDEGLVAFAALESFIGYGVYTSGEAGVDKVIRLGDPLFESTVTELEFFRGLNNQGQVAFRYGLASGVQGIAVATRIPEATAATLAIAGAIGGASLRPRRERRADFARGEG